MSDYIHKEFPKTCAPDDFFGQVKRTVNGKPVSQEQIDMILGAIRKGLKLNKNDILLDIGAGNGALSQYMFPEMKEYLGVDFSEYLIEVAKANFEQPRFDFLLADALEYVRNEKDPERFTKALCYGAFSYFSFEAAEEIVKTLHDKFKNIQTFYIGNLPDKDRANKFYPPEKDFKPLLTDRDSPLGLWRSQDEFRKLGNDAGWNVEFFNMPEGFYSAHYRYDAILTRK